VLVVDLQPGASSCKHIVVHVDEPETRGRGTANHGGTFSGIVNPG